MSTKTRPAAALLAIAAFVIGLALGLPSLAQDTYGPTHHGDDLWDIAERIYRDQGVTRDQAILALLKANPQAFDAPCNASSPLKLGVTLTVPPVEEAKVLSPDDALAEFERQIEEWKRHQHRGSRLVCPPISTTVQTAEEAPQQSQEPVEAVAAQQSEVPAAAAPAQQSEEPVEAAAAQQGEEPAEAAGTASSNQPKRESSEAGSLTCVWIILAPLIAYVAVLLIGKLRRKST